MSDEALDHLVTRAMATSTARRVLPAWKGQPTWLWKQWSGTIFEIAWPRAVVSMLPLKRCLGLYKDPSCSNAFSFTLTAEPAVSALPTFVPMDADSITLRVIVCPSIVGASFTSVTVMRAVTVVLSCGWPESVTRIVSSCVSASCS